MNKHTPGPWYLRVNRHRNCDGSMWGWLDTQQAGDQRPPTGVNVGWSEGSVSEANARLIAAAPDLLDAAQNVIKWADGCMDVSSLDQLRQAIKKATGDEA